MIPGSDLLDQAFGVIDVQSIIYYKANGRTLNEVAQFVTSFDEPVNIIGSMQPVPRARYEAYGLDFNKDYYTFYTSNDLIDVGRDVSGDQIVFNSLLFQCQSANDWFVLDGWLGILCIMIGPAPSIMKVTS